ncbi:MAG: hypothetical protein AAGF95_02445 [Chloroflexota bacterium]
MFAALHRSCFWYICTIVGLSFIALHGKAFSSSPSTNETPIYPDNTQLTSVPIPQNVERPAYLQPMIDSVFGTQVIRISDQVGFGSNAMALRHTHATNQPWNADGSLLMLGHTNPAVLLDGQTYAFLRWIYQPSDAMWLHTDPHSMIGTLSDTNQLVRFDIQMDWSYEIMHTFDEFATISLGGGQTTLSMDDRYLVVFGFTEAQTALLVYDLQDEAIISRLDVGTDQVGVDAAINNAGLSQSGEYIVLAYNQDGATFPRGIHVLDRDLTYLHTIHNNGAMPYDICIDTASNEAMIISDDVNADLISIQLETTEKTELLSSEQIGQDFYVSCRNINRPGWAYISHFGNDAPEKAYFGETFAVKLDGSGMVNRFAHTHHTMQDNPENNPMAVPNQDGSKVLWASDWGDAEAPIYSYVTNMSEDTTPRVVYLPFIQ